MPKKKLSSDDVQKIREAYDRYGAVNQQVLARQYGVTQATISRVVSGAAKVSHVRKLTADQVQTLRYRHLTESNTLAELGADFGLTTSEVWDITNRRSYADVPPSERELALIQRVNSALEQAKEILSQKPSSTAA